ncbi:uncharacterized protein [Drosophila virilis]|uniref:uncharacterized protein n=1 Tax=Drosophila virilis TaxID=7244 RepID=UPI0038B40AF2
MRRNNCASSQIRKLSFTCVKIDGQIAGCIIVHTLLQKLDSATEASWEDDAPLDVIPSCERLTAFIEQRCQRLENADHATAMNTPGSQVGQNNNSRRTFVVIKNGTYACVFCEAAGHSFYPKFMQCLQFAKLSPSLRLHEAKRLALCLNCLQRGHQLRVCGSSTCKVCGSKHHSLLHLGNTSSHSVASSSHNVQEAETHTSSQNILAETSSSTLSIDQHLKHDVILLATAVNNFKNPAGSLVPCRALLDSGSQLHIITSRLAHQLQLRKFNSTAVVSGIGDAAFSSDGFSVNINVQSRVSEYSTCIPTLIAPSITDNQPGFTLDPASWNIPSNIQLADPEFFKSQQIVMLIGASLFFDLLCVGQIKPAAGLLILQKTRFGWVATGGAAYAGKSSLVARRFVMNPDLLVDSHLQTNAQIDELIRRFWELEERDCEAHFQANFKRLPTGEYSVRLPLRLSLDQLGDSNQQALRRFLNLERKLYRNPTLRTQYAAFIKEYLDLNHMSLVSLAALGQCKYYLPHHSVLKEDSTTTKLRVVFEGSAATTSGHSLNDALMAEHPDDLDVLTPVHFLGTSPSSSYIEPDLRKLNFNRLSYFQRVTYLQQVFWARWREEYLTLLQQRSKWRTPQPGLSINDVVLVKDENLPPLNWPLARVLELISGSDGVSRVAVLQTATGVIRRAVRKLCLLPKQDDVESPLLPTGGGCLVKRPVEITATAACSNSRSL